MPVGIQRLNAKKSQPNDRIVFIKPLRGKDEAIAQDFLERIAAQCLPIMKEHHLSVTTLEEHEPNREFVGRNFNGGEIIQLVLKARSGRWLPFGYVQMVMMHELAHCVQMNHSRAFWKVRNLYADQLRALWGRGYTGDGMWGRGAPLATGDLEAGGAAAAAGGELLPEHLCGGAYRSRRRGPTKPRRGKDGAQDPGRREERKQRRIERRFGRNGVALGADDEAKARLEKGRRTRAAPRVAGSNRGRDLRAAAALARFEEQKQAVGGEGDESVGEGDESGASDDEESDFDDGDDAVDMDGKKLLDAKGNRMVKVCEDENPEGEEDAANELKELQSSSITRYFAPSRDEDGKSNTRPPGTEAGSAPPSKQGPSHTLSRHDSNNVVEDRRTTTNANRRLGSTRREDEGQPYGQGGGVSTSSTDVAPNETASRSNKMPSPNSKGPTCAICSFENEPYTVTCSMCSHVLRAADVPGTWKCRGASCMNSGYLNAGDCGACGACGQRKGAGA